MATFTKNELRQLFLLSDVNFCFVVCEKLLENHIHISGNKIVSEAGEEHDMVPENLKYFIERLFFKSSRTFTMRRDLDEVMKKHFYIFLFELSSSNGLATMLGA